MRFRTCAVVAVAVGSFATAIGPASADSYSQITYKVVPEVADPTTESCSAWMDGAWDDTQGYWVARGVFYPNGSWCKAALYRKKDGTNTWYKASNAYAVSTNTILTGWHWDGPGAVEKACFTPINSDDPIKASYYFCTQPY
ncbi:hypothetical protein [Streptomyces sp. CBMA152]|uniref:hypothetical protein n=1 Tax=Streptomyces sp. CBMA152 TaxID=1896312 RepID=UPI0016608302|nr:hypothetical protein [Streptomyces sp. CBMA152]MBD0742198.1 hypothetical protein [Streptomyces sp. CBMA152]